MTAKNDMPETVFAAEPDIHPSAFIAAGVQIIGDVRIGEKASIWYNSVLRGDINAIRVGKRTNLQDGVIVHLENDRACTIGDDITVGHRAVIHGCTLEDGCLIGMGAIVLNGAVVSKGAIVGAGAVVKENMVVPPNTLAVGVPAKIVKTLPKSTYEDNVKWAAKYCQLALEHKKRV